MINNPTSFLRDVFTSCGLCSNCCTVSCCAQVVAGPGSVSCAGAGTCSATAGAAASAGGGVTGGGGGGVTETAPYTGVSFCMGVVTGFGMTLS